MFFSPTPHKFFAGLALALLFFAAPPIFAQKETDPSSSPLSLEAQVDKAEVTIGDIVTYHLSIRHDPEIQLATPHLEKHFDGFIFIDQEILPTQKTGDQVLEEFKFRFRANQVGHYTHSKIAIDFTAPDPKSPGKLIPGQATAPKTVVVVRSVLFLDGEPTDIRDIKSILGSAFDWRPWALAVLGVTLAGLLVIYWYRMGRKKAASMPSSPALDPHKVALQELAALLSKKMIEAGRLREHYFELSEIFRRYLGARFSFPAPDWTSQEIMGHLLQVNFDPELRRQLLPILQNTDHVKFAKAEVDARTSDEDIHAIRQFIATTKHKVKPEENYSNNHDKKGVPA